LPECLTCDNVPCVADETQQTVRTHLNHVLGSEPFRRSPRCREFLQYVVEQTLDGRADLLKERSIGLVLFGRKADYETADDSIVRVRANEVRKRLALYYQRTTASGVQFDLSVGSYVPQITVHETALDTIPNRAVPGTGSAILSSQPDLGRRRYVGGDRRDRIGILVGARPGDAGG